LFVKKEMAFVFVVIAAASYAWSLVPTNCSKIITRNCCYQGSQAAIENVVKRDPLACKPPENGRVANASCSAAGFDTFKGNDPIFKEVELWVRSTHRNATAAARVIGIDRSGGHATTHWTAAAGPCPGGSLQRCMDGCLDMPPPRQQECIKDCQKDCPPAPPPAPSVLKLVSMDPDSLAVKVLTTDRAGDMLNSGSFGVVSDRASTRFYYTLMQPPAAAGIHLASFALAGGAFAKTMVPLAVTIAEGDMVDGYLCGADEDSAGAYFVSIDPASGNSTLKTPMPPTVQLGYGSTAVDHASRVVYHVGDPRQAPFNNFTLLAFSATSGAILSATRLHPTPDTQGPTGLVFEPRSRLILGFLPPVGGSWQLVSIEPSTGRVSPTAGLRDVPPMHGFVQGTAFLTSAASSSQLLLHAAFFERLGSPRRMLSIDVQCALATGALATGALASEPQAANCTRSNLEWSADGAPMDLAVDE
jgi:hypothetical protein